MSSPSLWPLPAEGIRFVAPSFIDEYMRGHILTKSCFPSAMGYYPKAVGHVMNREKHDDHLVIYCVDGEGELVTPDFAGNIYAGDIVLLEKNTPHRYCSDAENPWSIYWVHFCGEQSDAYVDELQQYLSAPVAFIGHSSAVLAGFKSLFGVRNTGYSEAAFIHAANQLRQLLTLLPLEKLAAEATKSHAFNLDKIQALMWENLSGNIDLELLASTASLSKYHFCNKYKKLTGYSPIKHFIHMKMEHACALLDSSSLSVKAIAAELGYDDAMYFSRIFKRTIGLSPREYRNKY